MIPISIAADAVYGFLQEFDLSWAQELATYMFVWMAKFGAALGVAPASTSASMCSSSSYRRRPARR